MLKDFDVKAMIEGQPLTPKLIMFKDFPDIKDAIAGQSLTPKLMNTLLAKYEDNAEYDLIYSYLQTVRHCEVENLSNDPYAAKEVVRGIVLKIEGLLKEVNDPALSSLRNDFLDEEGKAKDVATIPHSVFRCATMAIVAVVSITDVPRRKTALVHLNGILNALKGVFNTQQSTTCFNQLVAKTFDKHTDQISKNANKEIAAVKKESDEKMAAVKIKSDEAIAAVKKQSDEEIAAVKKELEKLKEEVGSSKTTMDKRLKNNKPPHNPIHDAHAMRQFWSASKVAVFELLIVEYQLQVNVEKKVSYTSNGVETMHRTFISNGHIEKKSELLLTQISALCKETVTPAEVILAIQSDCLLKELDIENRLRIDNHNSLFSGLHASDPVPGFVIPEDKKADEKYIKSMHQKLSRIANMSDDQNNSRLLPYNAALAKTFKEHVQNLEQAFPFLTEKSSKQVKPAVT